MADRDFLGGVTNTQLVTEEDGTFHVLDTVDAEPILDYTHAARNHRFDASALDGMAQHVAEIPANLYFDWCLKARVQPFSDDAAILVEKKLQDPQYAKFLAAPKLRDPRIRMKGAR